MSLALALASASFLFAVPQAQAQMGLFAYSWGEGADGRLGHGNNDTLNVPTRIGTERKWVASSTATPGGSFLVCVGGHVWTMGPAGAARGFGDNTISANVPTQIPGLSNIVSVASFSSTIAALSADGHIYTWGGAVSAANAGPGRPITGAGTVPANVPGRISVEGRPGVTFQYVSVGSAVYAICEDGYLYTWGVSTDGRLGRPLVADGGTDTNRPGRVQGLSNVVQAGGSAASSYARTASGELFTWGIATNGRLGRDITGLGTYTNVPGQVMIPPIKDVVNTAHVGAVITTDGRLFTWGWNSVGQLGQGAPNLFVANTPVQVGTRTDWTIVMGGQQHFLAFTRGGNLYAWGANGQDQLGIGVSGGFRNEPTLVVETSAFGIAARGGGLHSIMIMDTSPAMGQLDLTKVLEKPYGTPRPATLTFSFSMEAHSFNNDTDPAIISDRFPAGTTDITRTVTIDNNSERDVIGNIVELSDSTNILAGIEFDRRGVFSWIVTELPTTTPAVNPPSNVVFSQASYELRVYVRFDADAIGGEYYVYYITLHRLTNPVTGADLNPPLKVDDLIFTNLYTRVTAANQHFEIGKTITGDFANLSDTFTFEITLTRTALCPENRTFTGRVVDLAGNPVSPPRTYTFTTGVTQNVVLGHNERLIFDGANALTLGSTFLVVEQACPFHIASVRVYSYGTHQPPNPPNYVVLANTEPDQARTTNTHTIGANRNAALFTNTHQMPPPTGLIIGNAPYALVLAAGMMFAVLLATKARKRIEELPIMH